MTGECEPIYLAQHFTSTTTNIGSIFSPVLKVYKLVYILLRDVIYYFSYGDLWYYRKTLSPGDLSMGKMSMRTCSLRPGDPPRPSPGPEMLLNGN